MNDHLHPLFRDILNSFVLSADTLPRTAPQDSLAATESLVAEWNEQDAEREEARRDTRRWLQRGGAL